MSVTQDILNEIVLGLRAIFGTSLLRIVLYGSVARQEDTPESDIDIAVFLNRPMERKEQGELASFGSDMDLKYDRFFSIIEIEETMFQEWRKVLPFYQNVEKEGIVLWNAA